jgi:Carboxypeptidase regulatory-like domain/TonB-dependent Receptor Plug Domain
MNFPRLISILALSMSRVAYAQVNSATMLGTVTDPTGAAVAAVKITASNDATGFSRSVQSGNDGGFLIPLLPIGDRYRLVVEAAGFRAFARSGIELQLNQNARIDVQLQLGNVSEKVEVVAGAPLVDTYSAEGGEVVEQRRIVELPLNGRNALQLATLLPGVTRAVIKTALDGGNRGANYLNINGSHQNEVDWQMDGIHYAGANNNSGLNLPSPDALQEFKLITDNYSAEYGYFSGAVFRAVTRSGTNQIHGSAWEFLRNDALNARNFFTPTVPILRQNQFGASVGFPVLKNRLFGFVSYQGLRIRGVGLSTTFPPTAAQRQGIFSSSIKDPLSGQPFPGNTIPASRLDPVSQNLLKYIPLPPSSGGGQLVTTGSRPIDVNQWTSKWDYIIRTADTLQVSMLVDKTTTVNPFATGPYPSFGIDTEVQFIPLVSVGETHTFAPNVINEARFGRASQEEARACSNIAGKPRDFGINMDLHGPPVPPGVSVSGAFAISANTNCSWVEGGTTYQASDHLSWIKGRHNLKFGAEYHFRESHLKHDNNDGASFVFDGSQTGNAVADFISGSLASVNRSSGSDKRANSVNLYYFVQDDFKVLPRLTLNLGLRYEILGPFSEVRGLERPEVGIPQNATIRQGIQSTVIPIAPKGLLFVGDKTYDFPNGLPASMQHMDWWQVQPRFGLAWDIFGDGKTSLRAGYGLYSNAAFYDMYQSGQNAPFLLSQTLNTPAGGFADPWRGLFNPFPYKLDLKDPANSKNLFPAGLAAYSIDPNYIFPRIQEITFNIQRQVVNKLSIEVGYVGKLARHLYVTRNLNTAVYIPGNDAQGLPLSTLANTDARRIRFPTVFQKWNNQESTGNSSYHALQTTVRYRAGNGLTLMSSYTWSRSLDYGQDYSIQGVSQQDAEHPKLDYGPSNWDVPQTFRLSWVYEVPLLFAGQPVLRHLLSNWEFSGITSVNSGLPLNLTTGRDNSLTANGNDRPDVIGDPNLPGGRSRGQQVAQFFNTAAFLPNKTGQFGNLARNALRGPGLAQTDVGIFKNFRFKESYKIQFRTELFNALNQVNFNNPVGTVTAATFGRLTTANDPRLIQFGLKVDW